jgi:hypothetical protein
LFDQLVAHLPKGTVIPAPRLRVVASGPENLTGGSSKPGSAGGAADLPQDWAHIKVGSLVLATEDRTEGYFECIVVEAKPSDMFTLKWRDFPDLETIVRHRSNVALLFPSKISR